VSEGSPVVPGSFVPGSRIAGYLLEEQIGQGGMAVVFRAHDERLDRTVALKILAPALAADEAFRLRFIRESRAAAAVDDPHIIPVFEAGEASGVLFIAMRFVRGGDVKSLVGQGGPMPTGRAAEIISQAASALDAAHGRGLVHRDVKPANMLLDASSGGGRRDHIYLSDFGLSKGSLQTSGLTGTGTFLGTLDYISPEQIEGKPVDGRADEYALACAAFELLTGAPPFQRDEAMAVMYAQLSEPPPAVTSRRGDLSIAANDVFFRALAKAPADRYPSCREFADALRDALGMRPYDSGPGDVPSGEHLSTQVVRPSEPGTGDREAGAARGYAGQGAGQGGYPGPGYAGQGGYAPASDPGVAAAGGQGQGPAYGTGPLGPPVGAGAGAVGRADFGEPETQLAGGRRQTSTDKTAPHWQQGPPPDGFGAYGVGGGQASIARPWWKSPLALVAAVIVLIAGGAAAYALTKNNGGGTQGGSRGGGHTPHQVPVAALNPPGCGTAAATGPMVRRASQFFPTEPGTDLPFGVQPSRDGQVLFVVTDHFLDVLRLGSGGKPTGMRWHYPISTTPGQATTAVLTPDGNHLLVASSNGIDVFDVAAAENDAPSAFVGTLTVPGLPHYGRAINIAVTKSGRFAFVSLQFLDQVGVFNLGRALSQGFSPSDYIGSLKFGAQPVGLALSPNGQTLYATSWVQTPSAVPGKLTVIDVAKATARNEQKSAVVAQLTTGCFPARVAVTSDGKTLWVTTEQSNFLLGYSTSLLLTSPHKALVAKVEVGKNPIGLALAGSRIIVADSGSTAGPPFGLTVVDPVAALAGKPALLGFIPSRADPHEIALTQNAPVLYVTNRDASQIQVVNLGKVPNG
jgi:DNA-binding beta-propeller fold protein YncE